MPKLDLSTIPETSTSDYLPPYNAAMAGRSRRDIGAGLTDFGAGVTRLAPGAMSSQRHWHSDIDELIVVLAGEAVLIDDSGETIMRPGDIATFVKDVPDGHHLVNRGSIDAVILAVGRNSRVDRCTYSDIDMFWSEATGYVPASALGGG